MTAPAYRAYEGFSVSHAAILDGATGAEEVNGDIYGVRTASIVPDTGNFDNTGDDFVLSSWFWINFAAVTVESGYVPFDTIAMLSGTPVYEYPSPAQPAPPAPAVPPVLSTGPDDDTQVIMWDEDSANQQARPLLIRVPSRDIDGNPRVFDFVLFKVIFSPFSFTGPAYKDGLLLSYTGRAVLSRLDEKGNTLTKRAIGRMINTKPVVVP